MKNLFNLIVTISISISGLSQSTWLKTSLIDQYPVACMATTGNELFVGLSGGGIYKSDNEGSTWKEVNTGIGHKYITSIAIKGNKIYASILGEGVFISTNNGDKWTAIETTPGSKFINCLLTSGNNIIAATWDGLYYSSDDKNWTKSIISGQRKHNIVLSLFESKKGLLAGSGKYIFLSKDNGKSWESNMAGSAFDIYTFAEGNNEIFLGSSGEGIFQTEDGGKSWDKKPNNKSENEFQNIPSLIIDSNRILAGSPIKGVINDGDKMNQGLANNSVISLIKHHGFYFAGTPTSGLWKFAINGKIQDLEIRNAFELSTDLYPNPGTYNIVLKYSINQVADVNIDVVQVNGNLIKHLGYTGLKPGIYQLPIGQLALNSGIYYLRNRAKNSVQTKRLIIVE